MPGDHHGNSSACHMVIAAEERMFCIRSEGDCCLMFAILISVGEEDMRSLTEDGKFPLLMVYFWMIWLFLRDADFVFRKKDVRKTNFNFNTDGAAGNLYRKSRLEMI